MDTNTKDPQVILWYLHENHPLFMGFTTFVKGGTIAYAQEQGLDRLIEELKSFRSPQITNWAQSIINLHENWGVEA